MNTERNSAETNVEKVIGFDLGHGETAVSLCNLGDKNAPTPLDVWNTGSSSVITAIGWHPQSGVIIGSDALTNAKAERSTLYFKGDPAGRPGEAAADTARRNEIVQAYFKVWLEKMIQNNQIPPTGGTHFYVGCPSGWSPGSIKQYESLLKAVCSGHLKVIKESRAAFVNITESKNATLRIEDLRRDILIVDIGSSTTDLTLVHELVDEDFGNPQLGASLIEQTIFERTLSAHPNRLQWEAFFNANPVVKARCLLSCRVAKERYFQNERNHLDDPTLVSTVVQKVAGVGSFEIDISYPDMQMVLNSSQSALKGLSWREAFDNTLKDARERLTKRSVSLAALVLTGGPSRMQFVRDMCSATFPETRVQFDSSPEFCISSGLCYAGRIDARTSQFTTEIHQISASGKFKKSIQDRVSLLTPKLVTPLARGLIDKAIKPVINDWKNGYIRTLEDIEGVVSIYGSVTREGRIMTATKTWLESVEAKELVKQAIFEWFESIQAGIFKEAGIDALCTKYHVPASKLQPDVREDLKKLLTGQTVHGFDVVDLEFIGGLLASVVGLITVVVVHAVIIALHFAAGPFAWLVAIVVGGLAVTLGMEEATKKVKTWDMPGFARKAAFLWKSVDERCEEMLPKLRECLTKELSANESAFAPLVDGLDRLVKAEFEKKADELRVMVGLVGR